MRVMTLTRLVHREGGSYNDDKIHLEINQERERERERGGGGCGDVQIMMNMIMKREEEDSRLIDHIERVIDKLTFPLIDRIGCEIFHHRPLFIIVFFCFFFSNNFLVSKGHNFILLNSPNGD